MAPVPALADAEIMGVGGGQLFDDLPGPVTAAVVYEEDAALVGNLAGGGELLQLFQEHGRGDGKDLLLIVTGDHDI